jgi:hypothetical protein
MSNGLVQIITKENITTATATKCIWRNLADDPDSSTFLDVRRTGPTHRLYNCIDCSNVSLGVCENYKPLSIIYSVKR